MEDICRRIATVAAKVFKNLDNQDLIKCKESSKVICSFLDEEVLFAKRIIMAHFGNLVEFKDSWSKVIEKAPAIIVKQLSKAVQHFFKDDKSRFTNQWNPLQIAVEMGTKQICKYIIDKTDAVSQAEMSSALFLVATRGHREICELLVKNLEDKNPSDPLKKGLTPFHDAAANGHVGICKVLMKNLSNKNPGDNIGWTPLHSAAKFGYLEVSKLILLFNIEKNPKCTSLPDDTVLHTAGWFGQLEIYQLISKYVKNVNPPRSDGVTPLHLAAQKGHLKICYFISENSKNLSPSNNVGYVPLHWAALYGRLEVCKFLLENGAEKNPSNNLGFTPLHSAAQNGHIEVIKLLGSYVQDKNPKNINGTTPSTLLHLYFLKNLFDVKS